MSYEEIIASYSDKHIKPVDADLLHVKKQVEHIVTTGF